MARLNKLRVAAAAAATLLVVAAAVAGVRDIAPRPSPSPSPSPSPPSPSPPPPQNQRPLIGILAQACHSCPGRSYVAAAYVKWIEAAGGRAVPIRFYVSDGELRRLFDSVNGIIFPGGLTDLYLDDPYVAAATKLYDWAVESNDAGRPFPIWGTCLGHQLLQIIVTKAHFGDILVETDAVSMPAPLTFTEAGKSSRVWARLFDERPLLAAKLSDPSLNITIENHEFGMPPAHFFAADTKYPQLKEEFEVLNTAVDRKGVEYVATIEHRKYPFFGVQWHPEKPASEFSDPAIPHDHAAISVGHYLADALMDVARSSPHKPASIEQELADLIYNAKPVFTAREIVMEASYDGPDITYFFDKQVAPHERDPEEEAREAGEERQERMTVS